MRVIRQVSIGASAHNTLDTGHTHTHTPTSYCSRYYLPDATILNPQTTPVPTLPHFRLVPPPPPRTFYSCLLEHLSAGQILTLPLLTELQLPLFLEPLCSSQHSALRTHNGGRVARRSICENYPSPCHNPLLPSDHRWLQLVSVKCNQKPS